jgi:hypothetical protein
MDLWCKSTVKALKRGADSGSGLRSVVNFPAPATSGRLQNYLVNFVKRGSRRAQSIPAFEMLEKNCCLAWVVCRAALPSETKIEKGVIPDPPDCRG